jgi:polar amino acid transport system substrate-binding protein
MKRLIFVVLAVIFAVTLVGCKPVSQAPEETEVPAAEETHLDKIKEAGKIVVGTSADYAPFEYVDEAGTMMGFDVELMTEIAKRMDVELEWSDMPFDSLIASVQEGKIDASIAAFNYDEERDKSVDFTDAYYTSEDAFVVLDSFAGEITNPEDIAKYKVGAQSGTTQDGWITDTLVTAGLMDEANFSRYERVDQAALDLQAGRIEVLMSDYVPAQAIVKQYGGMKIIYHGVLSTGPVNIVIPEGDEALAAEMNRIIKELQDEGFIDTLATKYFSE